MRTLTATVALLLVLPAVATAQDAPVAIITGSSGGRPGDILLMDAENSVGDFFSWDSEPAMEGDRPTIVVIEGGRKCIVSSRPGKKTIFLAVSNANGIARARWTVNVTEDHTPGPNPPTPNPNPPTPNPPTPDPVIPDGRFAIAKLAHDAAMNVQSATRTQQAHSLAAGLDGVAASINAGVLSGAAQILRAILDANNNALGIDAPKWVAWGAIVSGRIKELYTAGMLRTPADWSALCTEIAIGLKAVK